MLRMHKTLDHEVDVLEHQFARNGVQTLQGAAHFIDAHRIEVQMAEDESKTIEGDRFLIAVGSRPYRPENVPFDGVCVFDSDDILELPRLPRSLTVVGAGVIGIEYATIFSALDVSVCLIESRSSMLDFVDRELMAEFTHELRDRGVAIRLGAKVDHIEINDGRPMVVLEGGRQMRSDMLLYAAGRMGDTEPLNLAACGLVTDDRGRLAVDAKTYQTVVPHIYAAGDVIGFPSLASTSMEQGRIAACHAFNLPAPPAPDFYPYGIYAVPEISTVGMTEEQVRERDIPFECGVARFRETSRGHIMGLEHGMMKMLFSIKNRRLLGVHIVGEGATELIHIGQAVLNLHGTLEYFVENTFNYPTLAEAYKIAALDAWNRMPPVEATRPSEPEVDEGS